MKFENATFVDSFLPFPEWDEYHTPLTSVFYSDLNNNGTTEIIVQAVAFNREAMADTWKNNALQIYGWNSGKFANETDLWFTNDSNLVTGSYANVRFGDFNNDGFTDIFAASFTDNGIYYPPSTVFLNTGTNGFTRTDLDFGQLDGHDSVVADMDGDGLDDIILADWSGRTSIAFSQGDGSFNIISPKMGPDGNGLFGVNASGLSAADYLGTGKNLIIATDAAKDQDLYDTHLYDWDIEDGFLVYTKINNLPSDRFYLPEWDFLRNPEKGFLDGHDVRSLVFDFNKDGLPDTVIFSDWPDSRKYAEIQFLQNDGDGRFTDVTDELLLEFDHEKETPSYQPFLQDINGDGLLDIVLSTGTPSSNSVLLQTPEGKFVERSRDAFTNFNTDIKLLSGQTAGGNLPLQILQDPNGAPYVFGGIIVDGDNGAQIETYIGSVIDSNSTSAKMAMLSSLSEIDSIGLTPDGKSLVIKINGENRTVGLDTVLSFSDTSSTAEALTQSMSATPVFSSLVNGQTQYVLPDAFIGPESLKLKYQLIDDTLNAVVTGSADNDFIKLANASSTGKAVDGGGGDDVIDGGVGSTFISGGGGGNTFFLDGRASGVSWSTITDFELNQDKATVWGWRKGISKIASVDLDGGADNFQGLTLHFENLLPSDASDAARNSNWNSITLSGKSLSDFGVSSSEALIAQINAESNPYFSIGETVDEFGTHGFLHIA